MENYSNITSYLSFMLNGEIFAIDVNLVVEVLEMQKITPIPKTKPYIKGVINFRGEILPVIDTRLKFNMEETPENNNSVIIVLEIKNPDTPPLQIGTIADGVKDVVYVKPLDIMAVPELNTKINTEYTEGIFNLNDNFITILNVNKIFSLSN